MGHATVSAKIDEGLRKKLREPSIRHSEVIRRALEEVERRIRAELYRKVEAASGAVSRIGVAEWVRALRESREER